MLRHRQRLPQRLRRRRRPSGSPGPVCSGTASGSPSGSPGPVSPGHSAALWIVPSVRFHLVGHFLLSLLVGLVVSSLEFPHSLAQAFDLRFHLVVGNLRALRSLLCLLLLELFQ